MLNYCQAREVAPMTPFVAAWPVVWCRNPAPVAIGLPERCDHHLQEAEQPGSGAGDARVDAQSGRERRRLAQTIADRADRHRYEHPYSFALFSVLAQQPAEAGDRRRARELLRVGVDHD